MTITIIQTACNIICFACTLVMTHKALKLAEMLTKVEGENNALRLMVTRLKNELNEIKNKKEND